MAELKQIQAELTFKICCGCGCISQSPRIFNIDGKYWCKSCIKSYFFECSQCKKLHPSGKKRAVKLAVDCETYTTCVCDECFPNNYALCSCCGYGCIKSNMTNYEDLILCKKCYNTMFVCVSCHRRLHRNYYFGGGLCRNCWEEEQKIINPNHNAKAPLKFMGQGPHFYGIELEVECDESIEKKTSYAKKVLNLLGDFVIIKHDGSIVDENFKNIGFEIVTVPASKDVQFEKWDYFFDHLPTGLKSFNTKTCGLHIHTSRKPLSQLTIAKMLLFINDPQNVPFITMIAGRNHNRFCKIQKKVLSDCKHAQDRYEALNLTNKNTVEFRIFRGTLKRESFKKSVEFCDALIHFCKECGHSISDCRRVDKFVEYVKIRKKDWIHLWAFICARWLQEENDLTKKMGFHLPDEPTKIETQTNNPN